MKNNNINYKILAGIIAIYGLSIRLVGLNKGIWLDEFSTIDLVQAPNFLESLRNYDHPPLYFLLLRLWSIISVNEVFLRIPSILFSLLSLIIMMLWLKKYSEQASLISGVLISSLPIFIRYSQEIRGYSLLILGVILSFYTAYQYCQHETKKWYLPLIISLFICVSTHLIGIFILPCVAFYLFFNLEDKKLNGRNLLNIIKVFLPPIILFFVIYFFFLWNVDSRNFWMPSLSIDLIASHLKIALGTQHLYTPAIYLSRYSTTLAEIYNSLIIYFVFTLLLTGMILGNWRESWKLIISGLFYFFQIIVVSLLIVPIFWYRTIIIGFVPLIAFFSIQFSTIKNQVIRKICVISIILISLLLSSSWVVFEARTPYEPWREAASFLVSEFGDSSLITFYPPYAEGPIRYYMDDLSDDQIINLDMEIDLTAFQSELTMRKESFAVSDRPMTLILVLRPDVIYSNNIDQFDALFNYLESLTGGDYSVNDLGTIRLYYFYFDE